ncbi:MAG: winged helix-turn-helix domain-containing protein [Hyphomicrobiaceae bacterium]|nr:winged helix-turn-helix domain-containing protein [Hyphomicrobiaceae bacterium]
MQKLVRIGDVTFDSEQSALRGAAGLVALRPKSIEVLRYLVEHAERIVPKDELLDAVWADVIVGENSLAQCITEIRRALGPAGADSLRTVPRRGYVLSLPDVDGPLPDARASQPRDLLLPDRPSIAVLPFANLGAAIGSDYFSEGIAEDIIAELSRFSGLFVIARNSSFQFDEATTDVRRVGRELGVRYVLGGSVRRDGGNVRITARLVEAASRRHIWSERYDRQLESSLAVQDEVAREIVAVLAVHIEKVEASRVLTRPPTEWRAYDHYLRGISLMTQYHSSYEKSELLQAAALLKQALAIDPTYARALASLSSCYISQWVHRWDVDVPWSDALDRALQAGREAVRLAPELPEALIVLGQALTFFREHDAAVAAVERAASINPNITSFRYAYTYVLAGKASDAAKALEMHMRLDPFYEPNASVALGFAYYMLGRYEAALPRLHEAVLRAPEMAHGRYVLAMTLARLGRQAEARVHVATALRLEPWYRISQSLTARYFRDPADTEHVLGGLRLAGFPE